MDWRFFSTFAFVYRRLYLAVSGEGGIGLSAMGLGALVKVIPVMREFSVCAIILAINLLFFDLVVMITLGVLGRDKSNAS